MSELVGLSRLDGELAELERERSGIPVRRAEAEAQRAATEERLASARQAVFDLEQALRRAEAEVSDQEALLSRLEAQQHQVKSNEAYTALLSEMDHAREAISEAETRVLEAMEEIEAARAALAAQEEQARGVAERVRADDAVLQAREETLRKEIAGLQERRAAQLQGVDPSLLARYEKIAARRRPAVSVVSEEICAACRVGIPPQAFIEICRGDALVVCGSCQRILIHADRLGA